MKRTLLLSFVAAGMLVPASLAHAASAPVRPSANVMHTDIAGGAAGSVPGVVAITTSNQYCTGSVIARRVVLTAGHCLTGAGNASTIQVRVNGTNQILRVARDYTAPGFDSVTHQNDAAVLILKSPVQGPTLPVLGAEPVPGTGALMTGYGQHTYTSSIASVAFSADTTVQSSAACEAAWAQFGSAVPSSDICAQNASDSATITRGDSGGPLLVQSANGHWGIAGINDLVVIPNDVYNGAIPQAFGRVDTLRPWIESEIARFG